MVPVSLDQVQDLLNKCTTKNIAIVGDVMLDKYYWGSVSRISPEAPVPVVDLEYESSHLGGAANVANNVKALGANPILCGVVGNDLAGKEFLRIAEENEMDTSGIITEVDRPTTIKTRILGNNQHIVRLDYETRKYINSNTENAIFKTLQSYPNIDGIIFQDYNKGSLTPLLIRKILFFAKENNIPTFVDPKFENFFLFTNTTLVKPNKKEASNALNITIKTKAELINAGKLIIDRLKCENLLITLGSEGMILFEQNGEITSIPTRARKVADVSGAGDTVIATFATMYCSGASIKLSATIANFASGSVCEEPGIVPITKEKLLKSIDFFNNNN